MKELAHCKKPVPFKDNSGIYFIHPNFRGDPVAQWVKHWPTDLATVSSSPARGEGLYNRKRVSTANSLLLSSAHRPDMTEILSKKTKSQVIHSSFPIFLSLTDMEMTSKYLHTSRWQYRKWVH